MHKHWYLMRNKLTAIILYTDLIRGTKTKQCKSVYQITQKTTILQHQIKSLKEKNKNIEIVVVAGKGYKDIEGIIKTLRFKNVKVIHEPKYSKFNQAELCINIINTENIENNTIIILGDVLFKGIDFGKLNNNTAWLINKDRQGFNIRCRYNSNTQAEYFFYDIPGEKQWSGIVFLNSNTIKTIINNIYNDTNTKQLFLFEILNILIENHSSIDIKMLEYKNIMKIINNNDTNKAKAFIR